MTLCKFVELHVKQIHSHYTLSGTGCACVQYEVTGASCSASRKEITVQ